MNHRFLLFCIVLSVSHLFLVLPILVSGATHTVGTLLELQDALDTASANNEADVITITSTTIDVTAALAYEVTNSENFPLTINGAGSSSTILDGGGRDIALLEISFTQWPLNDDNVIITINGITFQNVDSDSSPVYIDLNNATITMQDCTITNNTVYDYTAGAYLYSGGNITISQCNFSGNTNTYGGSGGASIFTDGSVEITNSTFSNNQVTEEGDGAGLAVYSDTATLIGNTITNNSLLNYYDNGGAGAFIDTENEIIINGNTFQGNTITEYGYGSGAYIRSTQGSTTVSNNSVLGNSGGDEGGGMYIQTVNAVIHSNIITNNTTEYHGGGMYTLIQKTARIYNNIIAKNSQIYALSDCSYGGGGLYFYSFNMDVLDTYFPYLLTNNTFADNTAAGCGGGLMIPDIPEDRVFSLRNTILWGNSAGGFGDDLYVSGTRDGVTMNFNNNDYPQDGLYVLNTGNDSYSGNIHDTPLFVDTNTNDYHLGPGSPCEDQGSNAYVLETAPEFHILYDFEGDERIVNSYVDIGADEYLINPDRGDVNNDQNVDFEDAILSLQMLTGQTTAETIFKEADVDDDGKLGLGESIYSLRKVAGLIAEYDNQTMEGVWLFYDVSTDNYTGYFVASDAGTITEHSSFNQKPTPGSYVVQPDGTFTFSIYYGSGDEDEELVFTGNLTSATSAILDAPYDTYNLSKISDLSLGAGTWSGTLDAVDVTFTVNELGAITSFNDIAGLSSIGGFFMEGGKAIGYIHQTDMTTPWDQIKLVGAVAENTFAGDYGLNNGSPDDDGDASLTREPITYKIATEAGYVPFEYLDANNQLAGFDIDLMNAIAIEGGFNIEFVNTSWDTIFNDVSSGLYDAAIAAITITPERLDLVDFSTPYINGGKAIMVLDENQESIQSSNDLNNKNIGVATNSAFNWLSVSTTANITMYQSIEELFTALITSEIEGIFHEGTVSAAYLLDHPEIHVVFVEEIIESYSMGISVNKERSELLQAIDSAINSIQNNGVYNAIYNSYFSENLFIPIQ